MSDEASKSMPSNENRFLRGMFNAIPAMIAYWDSSLHCRYANRAYLDWFGMAPDAMIGMHMAELLGERLFKLNEPYIFGALKGNAQRFERTLTKADGTIGYTLANYMPDFDETGQVAGFSVLVSDVTPLKLAEFQVEKAQARLQAVLDSVGEGIITVDANWVIRSANPAALQMFTYRIEQLLGQRLQLLMPFEPGGGDVAQAGVRAPADVPVALPVPQKLTGWRFDGSGFPIELLVTRIAISAEDRYVCVVRDVTLQQQVQDQLTRLAMTDGLTGLANRRRFDEMLALEFSMHVRSGRMLSLMLIDIDFFKQFNDLYGHIAGDDCLRRIALAVGRTITRTTDLAARYGGEEFACILPMTDLAGAVIIARQIQDAIQSLALVHEGSGVASHVTASIGIAAVHCTSDLSPDSIIRLADTQLYAAKRNGRNQMQTAQFGTG